MFVTSLKNQEEFELVNKRGKKLHGKYFILVIAKNFSNVLHNCQNTRVLSKPAYREEFKGYTSPRTAAYSNIREDSSLGSTYKVPLEVEFGKNSTIFLGIKVSKKLDKRAVIRNKIKRRIKHLTRLIINNPKFKIANLGMIVIPRKGFDKVDFSILTHELNKLIFQNL